MKTIATINFKGGVGKTTVTWCLGDVLSAYSDFNVLLFDLDAQASLTQAIEFGQQNTEFTDWLKNSEKLKKTTHAALQIFLKQNGKFNFHPDNDFIYRMNGKYHFVPAAADLYWVGMNSFDPEKGRVFVRRLLEKIANSSIFPEYDYIIFDCPPSFTPLSYSVLTCCDLVLIPVTPDFFAAKGVKLLAEGLRNKIEARPFPKTAVFANRVRGNRHSVDMPYSRESMWTFGDTKRYMKDVEKACKNASGGNIDIRLLNEWLPDRVDIGKAIANRRTPKKFLKMFTTLWKEIEEAIK